jgi:alpha-L-fucosidase
VACCGYGGQYNFNPSVRCGMSGEVVDPVSNVRTFVNISSACEDPSHHLIWDGLHPTQALNRQLALFFLNDRFVEGPTGSLLCNFTFTHF